MIDRAWNIVWNSVHWVLDHGSSDAYLLLWAQVAGGIVSGFSGAMGAFLVLTWQLGKDRERRLVEGGVELVQRRILQVCDQIREYRTLSEINEEPSSKEVDLLREALAATALLYTYLRQRIGTKKLRAAEQELETLPRADVNPGLEADPALRRYLHSAFFEFYNLARQYNNDVRIGETKLEKWARMQSQVRDVERELRLLNEFFDFTGKVLQRGLGFFSHRRKLRLVAEYARVIRKIQMRNGGQQA